MKLLERIKLFILKKSIPVSMVNLQTLLKEQIESETDDELIYYYSQVVPNINDISELLERIAKRKVEVELEKKDIWKEELNQVKEECQKYTMDQVDNKLHFDDLSKSDKHYLSEAGIDNKFQYEYLRHKFYC